MRRTLLSPLLLALALAAQDARGEMPKLWRWTDAEGIPRYTPDPDHVPPAQRGTLTRVEPGGPQAAEPAPEMRPAAIFVPPGEPALEADPFNAPAPPRVETEIVPPVPLETEPRAAATPAAPTVPAPAGGETPPRPAAAVAASPARDASASPAPPRAAARPSAQASEVVPIAAIEPEEVTLDAPTAAPAAAPAAVDSVPPVDAAPPTAPDAMPPVASAPAPTPAAGESATLPAPLEARRAELLAAIARDEETLKAHVSAGDDPLSGSPELREIAARLPALQAELRALEAQRDPR